MPDDGDESGPGMRKIHVTRLDGGLASGVIDGISRATCRSSSMKSFTTGLSVRFFKVNIAIGIG